MHIIQMLWALITEHWIISTIALVVGLPLLTGLIRKIRTRSYIASTLREIFPAGRPQPAQGRQSPSVKFSGKNLRMREMAFYEAFAKAILGSVVDKQIVLRRGSPKNDPSYGKFHIYLGYGTQGGPVDSAAKELFGVERVWDGKTYAYAGVGVPILDDGGVIAAEYKDDTIYFLVDPNLYGVFGAARVFAQVLARVAAEIPLVTDEESAGRFADALEKAIESSLAEKAPRRMRVEGGAEAELEEPAVAWQKMNDAARDAELEGIELHLQAAHELGREYDALCRVKKVESVTVTENDIELHTDTLYLTDPTNGAVYEMGRFKIVIPFSTGKSIVWKNKTRQVDGYGSKMMHLHVSSNGKACLGNTGPWFKKLIGERKFADAAQLAIAFIETVNPQDTRTYKYIGNWPRVS